MKEFEHEYGEHFYYTASEFEKKGGLWLVRAGWNKAKPNYAVGPKIIECYSIHFVLAGSVRLEYKDGTASLKAGDLFCLYPHQKYKYWNENLAKEPNLLRMYWFAFNGAQAPYLLERLGVSREQPYLCNRVVPEAEAAFQTMFSFMTGEHAGNACRLLASLYNIFSVLDDSQERTSMDKGEKNWIASVINYMNTHYMEGITVADVVQVAGVHRSHLYSELTRRTGMGPQQYLTKLRMDRAREMLELRKCTVTEVALSLGYADLYSFTRVFCKYYGIPPSRLLATQQNDK